VNPGELDPAQQVIAAFVGRKHAGKSKLARFLAQSYPYDQIIVDLHGDDRPWQLDVKDSGYAELGEIPARWPDHLRVEGKPLVVYYQPDAGSPTLVQDMDSAAGLAWAHGQCLLVVHEWGALALAHNQRERPMTSRVQSQGRKRKISVFECMHRVHNVDGLTLVQADLIYVMAQGVTRREDRQRIATDIGWDLDQFEAAYRELEPYGYLLADRRIPPPDDPAAAFTEVDMRLTAWPALTKDELAEVERAPAPVELADQQPEWL
jgi:hypothetical protein